jgi:ABC-2 type transport system permease protein
VTTATTATAGTTGTAGTAGPGSPGSTRLGAGRYSLADLARSEWTKLRSVRSTLWSFAIMVVLGVGVGILATAETRSHWTTTFHPGFQPIRTSLIGVNVAQLVIGVLGVLVMTGEYGTGTIRATFSAAPRRPMVLVAKAAVFTVVALVVSEIVAFLSFFLGQAMLTAPATHATLSSPGAWRAVVGSGLYICVIGLLGLALGVLVRHTAGAIGAFVGVLLILPIVVSALPASIINAVQRYEPLQIGKVMITTPSSAVQHAIVRGPHGIVRHVVLHGGGGGTFAFSPWVGFGILCGYVVALLVVGTVLLVRRDA